MKRFKIKCLALCLLIAVWTGSGRALYAGEILQKEPEPQKQVPQKQVLQELMQEEQVPQEPVPEPLEALSLYAAAAVLLDADSGRVLYEKNGFTPMAMASTTKIMTCIIALENADPDMEVEASAYAAGMPKVKLYVNKGEAYLLKDLLYSLMLESHNDSAVVIAENIGMHLLGEAQETKASKHSAEESKKAVAAFAALMNKKAQELGCRDTWFITPNGLDATETIHMPDGTDVVKEHSTTAADLARIMAYCIEESPQKDLFLQITQTASYGFSANGRSFSCNNHNAFLTMMEGAISGKTGFTNKAGYCYVGALKRDNRTFTVALLACGWPNHKTYKWSDARELMEYGLAHYAYHTFAETEVDWSMIKPLPVDGGCTSRLGETAYVNLVLENTLPKEGGEEEQDNKQQDAAWQDEAQQDTAQGLLLREDEQFQVRYTALEQLQAPVAAGTRVGCLEYLVGDTVYYTISVMTESDVRAIDFPWCLQQIWKRYIIA